MRSNGDGSITVEDFANMNGYVCVSMPTARFALDELTRQTIECLAPQIDARSNEKFQIVLAHFDVNQDSVIEYNEFIAGFKHLAAVSTCPVFYNNSLSFGETIRLIQEEANRFIEQQANELFKLVRDA